MDYALSTTVAAGFDETLAATRASLADVGFGVLTEIDLAATLKAKLDVDIPAQVVLGACRPPLAHAALEAEPSIGLLLPCNVVVRRGPHDTSTTVQAIDPATMSDLGDSPALEQVAADAGARLRDTLARVSGGTTTD